MILETFPVGHLQCNCTVLGDETSHEAIVIDPGGDPDHILSILDKHGLQLKQIVCTHTHIDHVAAIFELQERTHASVFVYKADLLLFEKLDVQAQWLGMEAPRTGAIDTYLNDGQSIACSGLEIGVIHTPGHTPGSTTFLYSGERSILFAGDTLFLNSIGRTDLWGGSQTQILSSIRNRLILSMTMRSSFPDMGDRLPLATNGSTIPS